MWFVRLFNAVFAQGGMRRRRSMAVLLVAAVLAQLAILASASAHGDLHAQIAELDRQIGAQPRNAALVLRRAELHRIHQEYNAADRDYARVLDLEPQHPEAQWLRARAWHEAGKAAVALPTLDRYLAQYPDHASARLTRARTLAALKRYPQAAADFALALDRLPQPEPDHYLELVAAQRAAGLSPAVQLASIDRGVSRLGSVPALEDIALDVEVYAKRWDAALFRLDRQADRAARKERLLFRRAQVLVQAGRDDEAVAAFRATLAEIDKLPAALRSPRAVTQLAEQAREELRKLGEDHAARPSSQ